MQSDTVDAEEPNTHRACVCKANGFTSEQSSLVLWPHCHRCLDGTSGVPLPIWFHLKATQSSQAKAAL